MARPRQVDMELVAQAQMLALEAETLEDLRCAQAVLLPGPIRCNLGGNRWGNGRGACHCAQIPSAFAQTAGAACGAPAKMGRSAQGLDERGRGAQLPSPLGEALRRRRDAGGVAAARGAIAAARTPGGRLGRVPSAGTPRLAQGGARHSASQERPGGARGMEKNSPRCWRPC